LKLTINLLDNEKYVNITNVNLQSNNVIKVTDDDSAATSLNVSTVEIKDEFPTQTTDKITNGNKFGDISDGFAISVPLITDKNEIGAIDLLKDPHYLEMQKKRETNLELKKNLNLKKPSNISRTIASLGSNLTLYQSRLRYCNKKEMRSNYTSNRILKYNKKHNMKMSRKKQSFCSKCGLKNKSICNNVRMCSSCMKLDSFKPKLDNIVINSKLITAKKIPIGNISKTNIINRRSTKAINKNISYCNTISDTNKKFKTFNCKICSYKAVTEKKLLLHLLIHGKKSFKCDRCIYSTYSSTNLRAHIERKHLPKNILTCNICSKFITTSTLSMKVHRKNHIRNKYFSCEFCWYSTKYELSLRKHIKIHSLHMNANQTDVSNAGMKQEVIMEDNIQCVHCKFISNDIASFKRHVKKFHKYENQNQKLKQKHIKKTKNFVQKFKLKSHSIDPVYIYKHKDGETFFCEHCEFKTSRYSDFENHLRSVYQIKPFKCQLCGFQCIRSTNLLSHIKRHTIKKIRQCSLCNYSTLYMGFMLYHQRTIHKHAPLLVETVNQTGLHDNRNEVREFKIIVTDIMK